MIDLFIEQITKEPDQDTILKIKLEIIDWIGHKFAGIKQRKQYLSVITISAS